MGYCNTTRSASHASSCWREMDACGKTEHVHDDNCYTATGTRKCPYAHTHTHGAGCVRKVGPSCGGV